MVPAQRGDEELFSQLGYLLSGDHERAARLARSAGSSVETLVRAWLDDPGEGYGRADVPAVAALPPRRRAAVVLRHWAGLPAAEVARILSCAEEEVDEPGAWWAEELRAVGAGSGGVRRRQRSVMIAVGVLAVAGVFATMLGVGSPEPSPEAAVSAPRWTPPPGEELVPLPPASGAVVVDAQARKLTAQLADAVEREFPELTQVRAGPSGPLTGNTERPPLEFFTRAETHPPGRYLAQAIVDAHGEGALVLFEVWREVAGAEDTVPGCPGHERDCVFEEFPDRTRAEVAGFLDPGSGGAVRRLTSSRPDGTVARVTAYGAPLSVAEMFGFALVFTW